MSQNSTKAKPIANRTQLFPCPHYVFCDIYNCRSVAKWFVGRPDGPRQCTFKLCESCAKDLMNIVPDGMRDEETAKELLKQKLTEQIRAEFEQEYADKLRVAEENLTAAQSTIEALQSIKPETEQPDADPPPPTPDSEKPQIFRCLDCNYEAPTADELAEHKKTHEEPPPVNDTETSVSPEPPGSEEPDSGKKNKRPSPQERLAQRRGQK